jgi:antitoxin component of MazEF toxin-antitoxin module
MQAKNKPIGEDVRIVSDQLLVADLEDGAEVDISVRGSSIVITPTDCGDADNRFRDSAETVMEKHFGLFKRLAGS